MALTESMLRRIIREEAAKVLREGSSDDDGSNFGPDMIEAAVHHLLSNPREIELNNEYVYSEEREVEYVYGYTSGSWDEPPDAKTATVELNMPTGVDFDMTVSIPLDLVPQADPGRIESFIEKVVDEWAKRLTSEGFIKLALKRPKRWGYLEGALVDPFTEVIGADDINAWNVWSAGSFDLHGKSNSLKKESPSYTREHPSYTLEFECSIRDIGLNVELDREPEYHGPEPRDSDY